MINQNTHFPMAEPEPEGPTRQFVNDRVATILAQREEILSAFIAKHGFDPESAIQVEQRQEDGTTTWRIEARTTPQPVPVSERLPGPGDCDAKERCWWFDITMRWYFRSWYEINVAGLRRPAYWLPAHALPLPNNTSRSNFDD